MENDRGAEISLEEARARLAAGEFAFVDGGCGAGGSLAYCERLFRKGRGLGFDASAGKIALAVAAGQVVCRADLATVELPERSVYFVSLLDFLEHLPDLARTREILANMARVARDFLFIRHPGFEDIEYLARLGLKLDWTDWHGHTNMMTIAELDRLIRELGFPAPTIVAQKPILDSSHRSIVPLSAPRDTVGYDPARHGPKPEVRFDRTIHTQFDVFVRLGRDLSDAAWGRIVSHVVPVRGQSTAKTAGPAEPPHEP